MHMWWIYQRRSGTCLGLYLCQLCWPNEQSNLLCSRSSRKSPRVWLSSTCRQFLADIACRSDTERAPTSVFCDVNCRHHTKSTANHHAAAEEDEEGRRLSLTVQRGSLVCMIIPTWLMILLLQQPAIRWRSNWRFGRVNSSAGTLFFD